MTNSFDPRKPYNALPELPPGQELETKAVLKLCIEARARLAELKELGAILRTYADISIATKAPLLHIPGGYTEVQ